MEGVCTVLVVMGTAGGTDWTKMAASLSSLSSRSAVVGVALLAGMCCCSQPVKGMDWIEDVYFLRDDTLVLGFLAVSECGWVGLDYLTSHALQTDMVLYSTAQNRHIVRINCGGGHRSYGVSSPQEVCYL